MQTETLNALAPYDALRANIEKMRNENANRTFQYETPKGNKLARSHGQPALPAPEDAA